MKVYEVMEISIWSGDTEVQTALFDTLQKAKRQKSIWVMDEEYWLEDLQSVIDNEQNDDTKIISEDDYFYAYDGINYDSIEITITEKEII